MTIHRSVSSSGDSPLLVLSPQHFELVSIKGVAGIRNLVVQTAQWSFPAIFEIRLDFEDPTVADIQINVCNNSPEVVVTSVISDGVQPDSLLRFLLDGTGNVEVLTQLTPAYR